MIAVDGLINRKVGRNIEDKDKKLFVYEKQAPILPAVESARLLSMTVNAGTCRFKL